MIQYRISAFDPKSHYIKVNLTINEPMQPEQKLRLPNWIPGSYLIRDFAKHITSINITSQSGQSIEVNTIDKSNWSFSSDEAVTIEYFVYAWDLSVRGSHFDESHAFFNGTSVFLEVIGQSNQACKVAIEPSEISQQNGWKVATGMPKKDIDANGFGLYQADNYHALIDYPVEMGTFTEIEFKACGIPHKMVITGVFECDEQRLKQDLVKICETEINLFGQPAPVEDYLFQVMVTGSDYGGLEHRNSTALICSRDDLPYVGMEEATDGYLQFLELCSHEYFHTWNVKRIQPKVYQDSDLQTPVYTNQLWWFEGITSYYDGLILQRAGLVDNKSYLNILAKQMTRVYRMPGRFKQSVSESSWLTWTKFYQQDENAPNAIISYYSKGSLIALGLDLTIRIETKGQKSLDDVLLYLWEHFGKSQTGLVDGQIEDICSEVSGIDLTDFFADYLFGTKDIPFTELFAEFGIDFNLRTQSGLDDLGGDTNDNAADTSLPNHLGANVSNTVQGTLKITHVWNNQPAYEAGLTAGDEVIALNGLKISTKAQLETLLKRHDNTKALTCHYFRRDELRKTSLMLEPPLKDRVALKELTINREKLSWLL
ncbi:M61 family metallopeptidase [Thiomicrorhabdus lithotrophica]|uniref:PDZ domain-containing protein n=1 Tax=Thiomicrorhabdus lithotrophica TaxID=2949997 RepID=A0ABY8CCM8_9GAMM|nr:PDZ domain-containing protein [Thiomicrorhabdus lithotrophica]WEJ63746.1 PDZ domain-containing protein [Thiomicrorhabdus lithotrophica]